MNCKLYKEVKSLPSKIKGEKDLVITNFYLVFENGTKLRIMPNTWTDKDNKRHSNTSELKVLASDNLPF